MLINRSGTPQLANTFHIEARWILSKAAAKSMKHTTVGFPYRMRLSPCDPICYGRTPNTIWFRQKQNLVFGVTHPWPLGTQFWVRGHRHRTESGSAPRFAIERHPTRYGSAKKTWFLGSRIHDPWVPSWGSGVIDTGKLISKSDSATLICYGRTPNTIWFRQKQNLVFGVTNPWPLGTQFWVRGHRYRKTGFKIGLSDPDLIWKDTQHDMVSAKTKLGFWGHEPMTPGYPVLGQGSSIQENWFQNRTQRPRFSRKGHPTRYGSAKRKKIFFLICIISLIS